MMKIKYASVILLFFVSLSMSAQQAGHIIEGMVADTLAAEPVEMATVVLRSQKDLSLVQGTVSSSDGRFTLKNIKPAAYRLTITFLGYDTVYIDIPEKRFAQGKINLGKINLHVSDIQLASIVITAQVPEFVVREDTIEYNAAAFKLPESAVVEDLFKRLPGVEVDTEGKITTPTGKEVKRVFVDGKEFFGGDPKMATRNLTADMVDKVQVVEKKSDMAILTGVEDDDPETVINITIKKGMKKGWMGNVNAGAGGIMDNKLNESARYSTAATLNRFTGQDQFSFVANANNVNRRASTDRGNTVRAGRGGGAGGNGITSSNTIGLNTNNIINDKLKFGGNVSYNYSDNYVNNSSVRRTFFENDSSTFRTSASHDRDYSNNISFNGRLEYKPDSATTMVFTPSASYNFSSSRSGAEQLTLDNHSDSINRSQSSNTMKSDGLNLRMQVDISRKLSAAGRRTSFSGWLGIDNSTGDGTNNSQNIFYRNHRRDKILDQQSHTTGDRLSYNLRATYVEPVGSGNFLNFSYQMQVNSTKNRRTTLDYDDGLQEYATLNPDYSKSSDTYSTTQNIRANFNSNKTDYAYNAGISISPVFNKSRNFIKDWYEAGQDSVVNEQSGRKAVNYSPFLDFTYRFRNENRFIRKNLRLRYNGQTRQPSITQLDPSENNTNPLNIRSGNSDLLPSFNNNISLEFNSSNRGTQRSLTTTVSHTFVQNQIINYTSYDAETGVQHTRPINENGTWNSSGSVFLAIPLDSKKRFKFSARSQANYDNNIQYSKAGAAQASLRYVFNTLNLRQELNLSYSNNWYYGQLRGNIRYQNTRYSLEGLQGINSYNYNAAYNMQLTLPWGVTVSSDIAYTGNSGLSAGYNRNEVIWNAEIGKQFLAQNRGSLRLQVTDILQQRLNVRRSVGGDYIQDSQFTALSSYFMVTFAYRFSNVGGGRGNRGQRFNADERGEYDGEAPAYDRGSYGGERPSGGFGGGRDREGF